MKINNFFGTNYKGKGFLLVSSDQSNTFLEGISSHDIIQVHATTYSKILLKPLIFNSYKLESLINCILKNGFIFIQKYRFYFSMLDKTAFILH